jgi:PHP family Zn ribbon phosphoesterase
MREFKADMHIHTVLSPCGSLEMSPKIIVKSALDAGLDIIAITDHNSTKQSRIIKQLAEEEGLMVICGAEINSMEEVHCIALFEHDNELFQFQEYLDQHLIPIKNDPSFFGFQVVVDEDEMILEEEERLLINALDVDVISIEMQVHQLNGLFIPAHIDRPFNGILSQLGFIPEKLKIDAVELSQHAKISSWIGCNKIPQGTTIIQSSDAHQPEMIGKAFTTLKMETASFDEIRLALLGQKGRSVSYKNKT